MRRVILDTNVLVSGVLSGDPAAPTCRIVDAVADGHLVCVVSVELLAEYRAVLLRPHIRRHHGLAPAQIDRLLQGLVEQAVVRDPPAGVEPVPDPGDAHLWALAECVRGAVIVTGDQALLQSPPSSVSVVSPRAALALLDDG